jgi:hypothetical protein
LRSHYSTTGDVKWNPQTMPSGECAYTFSDYRRWQGESQKGVSAPTICSHACGVHIVGAYGETSPVYLAAKEGGTYTANIH